MSNFHTLVVFFCILLNGCTSNNNQSIKDKLSYTDIAFNHQLFVDSAVTIISEEDLFTLTTSQKDKFLNYYYKKLQSGEKGHSIVNSYLGTYLGNFTYYGKTHTASVSLDLKEGNCMSLAILTVAFAKLIDLEFDFKEVFSAPVFEKKNNLLLSSSHVQTRLFDPTYVANKSFINIGRPGVVIDYFPDNKSIRGKYLSYNNFLSLYYRNIAADALVNGDLDYAFANAIEAHTLNKFSSQTLNLLGVIHRRKGDSATAEKIYLTAMQNEIDSLTLLNNYIYLLETENRSKDATLIKNKLVGIEDPNPYNTLNQANTFKDNGQHNAAIKTYKRVIDKAPYISSAYLGLSQAYSGLGQVNKAQASLNEGLEWTYDAVERKSLKFKLYGLKASPY